MTPQEKAVIEAARNLIASDDSPLDIRELRRAVADLPEPPPEWVTATFRDCLAGDRIRLGQEETDVIRCSSGIWHVDTSDAWRPRAWEHLELRMDLAANPGFQQYPPNTPCEILCTPARAALLTLQSAFPGSTVISSDVD